MLYQSDAYVQHVQYVLLNSGTFRIAGIFGELTTKKGTVVTLVVNSLRVGGRR